MMSKEFLKHLGILGITVGLMASPLVMAQQTQQDPAGQQESGQVFDSEQGTEAAPSDPTMDPTAPADPAYPAAPADPGAPSDPTMDPAYPADSAAPADPGAPSDPIMDPTAPADPAAPSDEPGFGDGADPMPGAEAEQDEWEEDDY